MLLLDLVKVLSKFKVPYAIVGGYAVALHGATRGTLDIDLIIPHEERHFINIERALVSINLTSRLPISAKEVFAFRDEYIKNRNLVAWSFYDPNDPLRIIDIIITVNLAGLNTRSVTVRGKSVQIISIEDLIDIKTASGRPQDLEDIKALRELQK